MVSAPSSCAVAISARLRTWKSSSPPLADAGGGGAGGSSICGCAAAVASWRGRADRIEPVDELLQAALQLGAGRWSTGMMTDVVVVLPQGDCPLRLARRR